jgi:hypothetical protein
MTGGDKSADAPSEPEREIGRAAALLATTGKRGALLSLSLFCYR